MTSIITADVQHFDYIQSFFIDPKSVGGAAEVNLTGVDIFFKKKPHQSRNISGMLMPGVTLWLCEMENDQPKPSKRVEGSIVRVEWNDVNTMADASVDTSFDFNTGRVVTVKTNKHYGIVINVDDPAYEIWVNKVGDKLVGTTKASPGSSNIKEGKLYIGNQEDSLKPLASQDLKFRVNAARYVANTANVVCVNKDYEFFTVERTNSTSFKGGEWVYQDVANSSGTLAVQSGNNVITGTGTTFDTSKEFAHLAVYNGATFDLLQISKIVNTSVVIVANTPTFSISGAAYKFPVVGTLDYASKLSSKLYLVDSTAANSTFRFGAGNTLIGELSGATATITTVDNINSNKFRALHHIKTNPGHTVNTHFRMAYYDGTKYTVGANTKFNIGHPVKQKTQKNIIMSRSNEVTSTYLHGSRYKSSVQYIDLEVNKSTDSLYTSPTVSNTDLDIVVTENLISNAYTVTTGGVVYDTEVTGDGIAMSKYISKKVTFANNRLAEDIKVYVSAYRPIGTEIRLYCKIHNSTDSDSFDSKDWTPLEITENADNYSSTSNEDDLVEYTYELPAHSEIANTLPGSFVVAQNSNVLVASGVTPSSYLAANDAVKFYNPVNANTDYQIAIVTAANSTAVVIGDIVSNSSIFGTSGLKMQKLKYPNSGFNNPLNDNICRYYNNSFAEFDKFDSMQLKIVLLADDTRTVPEVEQYQFIGVSA